MAMGLILPVELDIVQAVPLVLSLAQAPALVQALALDLTLTLP